MHTVGVYLRELLEHVSDPLLDSIFDHIKSILT